MVFIKGEKIYRKPVNAVIKLRKSDKKVIFLSNNSTLSRQEAAYNAGIDSMLVLTSVARKEDLLSNYPKPTFVLEDLLEMFM